MRENEAVDTTKKVEPEPFSSEAVLDNVDGYDPAYVARYDLERVAGALTGAYADLITVMRESLTEQHWAVSGIRSPEHWLTCFAGVSRAAATDIVRIASRANELPHAIAAFERTEITFHQLAVIARHVPAGFDEDVTRLAPHCDVGQLRRAVAKYPFPTDGTDDDDLADDVDEDGASDGQPDPATRSGAVTVLVRQRPVSLGVRRTRRPRRTPRASVERSQERPVPANPPHRQ